MNPRPNFAQQMLQLAPVVAITIAINLLVFVLWQVAIQTPAVEQFMAQNFLTSGDAVTAGRLWTLLTSAYSHFEFWHIFINMFVLWSFGVTLERVWGSRTFLSFYLACSVAGSLGHWLASAWLLHSSDLPALGASGAVCGLLMAFGLQFPKATILVFGIVPVPALIAVLGLVAFDAFGLIEQTHAMRAGGIGHGAHLAGGLCGAILWFVVLRQSLVGRDRA